MKSQSIQSVEEKLNVLESQLDRTRMVLHEPLNANMNSHACFITFTLTNGLGNGR